MKNNSIKLILSRYKNNLLLYLVFIFISVISINISQANTTLNKSDTLIYPQERFYVSFGGFLTSLKSDVILGSQQVGLGVALNLEDAFGLDASSLVIRSEAGYHFGKRRRSLARFGYFAYFRNATKVIESEIEIDDKIYPIGTEINSKSDFQIFKGAYDLHFIWIDV